MSGFCVNVGMEFQTRVCDAATGAVLRRSPWQKNLVLDKGLNALARGTNATTPALLATYMQVGSGTNPNSYASGAITFTQSTTTITASAPFFASNMVGGIFKYGTGTGGAEYYITAFTDTTHVTVGTSATVGTPTVATVWMVQQTALQTFLFQTNTYQTTTGDCETTFPASNQVRMKRTYVIAPQASPYTVNEIGYSPVTGASNVYGRAVLAASDVVGTSNFYIVAIVMVFTYSPSSPTAVSEVGTGISVAGNAMIEAFAIQNVGTDGVAGNPSAGTSYTALDGATSNLKCQFASATYSQNSVPATNGAGIVPTALTPTGNGNWTNVGGEVGKMTLTVASTITTAGQTLYGLGIYTGTRANWAFDVKFTVPQTAPSGSFITTCVFSVTYGRTLTN
jgi:hypothetical protein